MNTIDPQNNDLQDHGPEATGKQMLLCTLCPFMDQGLPTKFIEATINVNFRNREIKFNDTFGTSSTIEISKIHYIEWLGLIGAPYCKLVALLDAGTNAPLAVRLYLQKDKLHEELLANGLCEANILSFETILGNCIRESGFFIEPEKKRRAHASDLTIKSLSACSTVKILEDLYWSFDDLVFAREIGPSLKLDLKSVALVSNIVDHWRPTVLQQVSAMNMAYQDPRGRRPKNTGLASTEGLVSAHGLILVISNDVEAWAAASHELHFGYSVATNSGISGTLCALPETVVIASADIFRRNIESTEVLMETLEVSLNNTLFTVSPRPQQIKRFFIEKVCQKFKNIDIPINLIQFGSIIIDDIEDPTIIEINNLVENRNGLRWLQIVRDNQNTKPRNLTKDQASLAIWSSRKNSSYLPLFINHIDLTTICLPKQILKRFKVFGNLIKNGPIEEKISKIFQTKYCPLSLQDSIQRFCGRPVPLSVAKSLLLSHQDRLNTSLGAFLMPVDGNDFTIARDFATKALDELEAAVPAGPSVPARQCSICFDELKEEILFAICGHTYCADCAKQQFGTEWALNKSKECAHCRCPLLCGDVLHINTKLDPGRFQPALPSKESSIANFVSGIRQAPFKIYGHGTDVANFKAGASETAPRPKYLLINDIANANAAEIIREYSDTNLSIQIFYNQSESTHFNSFLEQF